MAATKPRYSAEQVHAMIEAVDLGRIPVMTNNRRIPRKEQAALARALFKRLGIKGVSVTAPNYSMAMSVDVGVPHRDDYLVRDSHGYVDWENDPIARANGRASSKIRDILAIAFPNHDDRSDSMSDYFDFKWSVS